MYVIIKYINELNILTRDFFWGGGGWRGGGVGYSYAE